MEDERNDAIEQVVSFFRTTVEKGYKFVLCVETPPPGLQVTQTNMADIEVARMLERFAKSTRENL